MTDRWRNALRFRIVRWPFYRLVWLRNVAFATGRWVRNYVAWLLRVLLYRGIFLVQWMRFAIRWTALRVSWLMRLAHNAVLVLGRICCNHLHVWLRRAEAPFRTREAARSSRAELMRHWRAGAEPHVDEPAVRAVAPTTDLVMVVHAHHVEVLPDILESLERFALEIDATPSVLLTVTRERAEAARVCLQSRRLQITLIPVENRGRDVLPFLQLAQRGLLRDARLVLKVHTKVSSHRDDGHEWRDSLVAGLTDAARYGELLRRATAGEEFVAVPRSQIFGARDWGRNVRSTARLAAGLGIEHMPFRFRFPAGTMFWITNGLVERLASLPIAAADFEPEPLPLDGALPHAVERVIGIAAGAYGSGVIATEQA